MRVCERNEVYTCAVVSGICVLGGNFLLSLSQGWLYKRAEDRAAQGCTEMKSKSQTVLRGGQPSKRMAHILLVEKPLMKGNFIAT